MFALDVVWAPDPLINNLDTNLLIVWFFGWDLCLVDCSNFLSTQIAQIMAEVWVLNERIVVFE